MAAKKHPTNPDIRDLLVTILPKSRRTATDGVVPAIAKKAGYSRQAVHGWIARQSLHPRVALDLVDKKLLRFDQVHPYVYGRPMPEVPSSV